MLLPANADLGHGFWLLARPQAPASRLPQGGTLGLPLPLRPQALLPLVRVPPRLHRHHRDLLRLCRPPHTAGEEDALKLFEDVVHLVTLYILFIRKYVRSIEHLNDLT